MWNGVNYNTWNVVVIRYCDTEPFPKIMSKLSLDNPDFLRLPLTLFSIVNVVKTTFAPISVSILV